MNKKDLLDSFKKKLDAMIDAEKDEFEIRHFIIDFCIEHNISDTEIAPYIENAPVWDVVPGILEVIGSYGSGFILR